MKKILLTTVLLLLIALSLTARAESTGPVEWQGHRLTPVYGMKQVNSIYRVRVQCDDAPLALLYEHKGDFLITTADGAEFTPSDVLFMGYYAKGVEEGVTVDFFDLYFKYEGNPDFSATSLSVNEGGAPLPLPDGSADPAACVFETNDGAWAVTLVDESAADTLAGLCAEHFNGQDVTLYLDGVLFSDLYAAPFLSQFQFASLDLFTTLGVGSQFDAEVLTALTLMNNPYSLPVMPNVKTLTCRPWKYLPERLSETFPNLETLNLWLDIHWPMDTDSVLGQNDRPANVSGSLRALEIKATYGDILTTDPNFRVWLASQRAATPSLTINGVPASEYDLADGLPADRLDELDRAEADAALLRLYREAMDRDIVESALPDKVVVMVVNRYGFIDGVSTDQESRFDFSALPAQRLAGSLEEANAVAVVYPVLNVVGKYNGVFDAYSLETRIALIDPDVSQRFLDDSVSVRQPPQTVKLGSGENAGAFEVQLALDALSALLQ